MIRNSIAFIACVIAMSSAGPARAEKSFADYFNDGIKSVKEAVEGSHGVLDAIKGLQKANDRLNAKFDLQDLLAALSATEVAKRDLQRWFESYTPQPGPFVVPDSLTKRVDRVIEKVKAINGSLEKLSHYSSINAEQIGEQLVQGMDQKMAYASELNSANGCKDHDLPCNGATRDAIIADSKSAIETLQSLEKSVGAVIAKLDE